MSKPVFNPVFKDLHIRIHELPENFKGFVQSECKWSDAWYALYLRYPEKCSTEDLMIILKIAGDLAHDLQTLVSRCKKKLLEHKINSHEIQ